MFQFTVWCDLFKASRSQQAIAGDFLEVGDGADAAQIERGDWCVLVSRQQRFVHDVFHDAGQAHGTETGADRQRSVAEDSRHVDAFAAGTLGD